LGCTDIAAVKGESVAAASRSPSQTGLCKLTLAGLLREVKINVVKALPDIMVSISETQADLVKRRTWWRGSQKNTRVRYKMEVR